MSIDRSGSVGMCMRKFPVALYRDTRHARGNFSGLSRIDIVTSYFTTFQTFVFLLKIPRAIGWKVAFNLLSNRNFKHWKKFSSALHLLALNWVYRLLSRKELFSFCVHTDIKSLSCIFIVISTFQLLLFTCCTYYKIHEYYFIPSSEILFPSFWYRRTCLNNKYENVIWIYGSLGKKKTFRVRFFCFCEIQASTLQYIYK